MSYRDRDRDRDYRDRDYRDRGRDRDGGRGGGMDNYYYGKRPPKVDHMVSLKVDNLSFRMTPDDLRPIFEKYGEVGDIYIPRDRYSKESRGFAFVRYYDRRDAEDAMDRLDGYVMDGRDMRVQLARFGRPSDPPKRSSYGGRRSSRGYGRRSHSRSYSRSRSRSPRRRSYSRSRSPKPSHHPRSHSGSRSRSNSPNKYDRNGSRSPSPRNDYGDAPNDNSPGSDHGGSRSRSDSPA